MTGLGAMLSIDLGQPFGYPQVGATEPARSHNILHPPEHGLPVACPGRLVGHEDRDRRRGEESEKPPGWRVEPVPIRNRRPAP